MNRKKLAEIGIIGGSGFYDFFGKDAKEVDIKTEFGKPSDKITIGNVFGKKVAFLPRHGKKHQFPPHKIPYKANIVALKQLGVEIIIAPSAVGSLKENIKPGDFVVCDQFIDRTKLRDHTFYHGPKVAHIEAAYPYCEDLRKIAFAQAKKLKLKAHAKGTVAVIEGPRFSTVAESIFYAKTGCDVINMTQYPEVVLAAEQGICYLNISLVTDYDAGIYAGKKVKPVSIEEVLANFKKNNEKLKKLISEIIKNLPQKRSCDCQKKAERAII
jgi:5'-methylthioadenosine phosphorylase